MSGAAGTLGPHLARIALAPLVGAIAFLAFPRSGLNVPRLTAGSVAAGDVIAPLRYLVLKDDAARAREAEAMAAMVKPVITVHPGAGALAAGAAGSFFAHLDSAAAAGGDLEAVARTAGLSLAREELARLGRQAGRSRWRVAVVRALGLADGGYLGAGVSAAELGREVVVREAGTERVLPAESVRTFSDFLLAAGRFLPGSGAADEQLFVRLLGAFYRPTLVYEREETERQRDALRRSVDSVESVVLAGQKIVGAHEVVTPEAERRLAALRRTLGEGDGGGSGRALRAAGGFGLNTLVLGLFGVICYLFRPGLYRDARALTTFAAGFAVVVVVAGLLARHAPGRVELIPVALPAILLSVLFDGRIAAVAAMAMAVLIGTQPAFRGTDALFVTFAGGVAAALSMRKIRSRTQVYTAVLVVTALYAMAALVSGAAEGEPLRTIGVSAGLGGVNALGSAALAMLVLPLAETLTRSTTDLRLLELSDPNRPLLRRLATEAPGTYAHSVAMANLCEAACNAIGANGLLARVGCYYHDVGKLKHPQFFVENLGHARNPHSQLSAAQSAALIRRHVEDGLALAAEHHVPEVIRRFIPEHHGTAPITYFLERARDEGNGSVHEDAYHYPGPRPHSAETAVAMLADSVEAALRVLDEPTPETVQGAIEHLVEQRIESGQLREAPLTLHQIEIVKAEFVRVLTGMYHERLDYPEDAGGITADWEAPRGP